MHRVLLLAFLLLAHLPTFAQEPANHLGRNWNQVKTKFPGVVNTGLCEGEEGDLWIAFDEDEYHEYDFYFVVRDGRVQSESLRVSPTGVIPEAGYLFYITTVKKYYSKGGWEFCDVDNSILRAASVFNSEHRIIWVEATTAELEYSNFLVYFQYNDEEKYCFMTYYPR